MVHPNEMTRDELRKVVDYMSWEALNLAQHLDFTGNMKPEYQAAAYKKAVAIAYALSHYPYGGEEAPEPTGNEIAVFGEDGLTVE